jgi:hypothetical protein
VACDDRNSGIGERILRYMTRLRAHISYANVTATVALFIALGGTSYAVTQLPRNSVDTQQIRTGAVRSGEIKDGAVRSRDISNRGIALRDISLTARRSLRGQVGPPGPPGPTGPGGTLLTAAVNSGGGVARGVGVASSNHDAGTAVYELGFNRDLSSCVGLASLSDVPGGATTSPQNGEIVTSISGSTVVVRTRNSGGAPTDLPFHLIVSC